MLSFREKAASIDDLVVVNFRSVLLSQAICDWRAATPVAMAESCSRQIWFGEKSDFETFPKPTPADGSIPKQPRPQFEYYEGRAAYAFLLKLISGMDSIREGETNIAGQFYPGWTRYTNDHPHRAKRLDTIIQHLRADSALIRSEIVSGIKPKRHELAARTLSRQAGGDIALVIGSLNDNNVLSSFTDGIVKALGNNRKSRVCEIVVTHPDPGTTGRLLHEVSLLKKTGYVQNAVSAVDFTELASAFENTDRVYVDIPMNSIPGADQTLIDTWKRHANPDNTLTHLRGEPANRGLSSPEWAGAGLQNYISPEDIRAEMVNIDRNNAVLRVRAMEAIAFCTDLRHNRLSPSKHLLQRHFGGDGTHPPKPRPLTKS